MIKKFKFTIQQHEQLERLLTSAIDRAASDQTVAEASKARINIFISLTELDVHDLRSAGRYAIRLSWFASQLAERFNTLLGIKPTPTQSKSYYSTLQVCYECAEVIATDTNIYRYAKDGIDAISIKNSESYKLLSNKERSIAESIDNAKKLKKRSLVKKRKIKMKQTLKDKRSN